MVVAEFIEGAQSSEGALLCEAELPSVDGVRLLPVLVDAVVDAGGKHRLLDWSSIVDVRLVHHRRSVARSRMAKRATTCGQ